MPFLSAIADSLLFFFTSSITVTLALSLWNTDLIPLILHNTSIFQRIKFKSVIILYQVLYWLSLIHSSVSSQSPELLPQYNHTNLIIATWSFYYFSRVSVIAESVYFLLGPMLNPGQTRSTKKHRLFSMTRTRQLSCFLIIIKSDFTKNNKIWVLSSLSTFWFTFRLLLKTNTVQRVIKNSRNEEKDEWKCQEEV